MKPIILDSISLPRAGRRRLLLKNSLPSRRGCPQLVAQLRPNAFEPTPPLGSLGVPRDDARALVLQTEFALDLRDVVHDGIRERGSVSAQVLEPPIEAR